MKLADRIIKERWNVVDEKSGKIDNTLEILAKNQEQIVISQKKMIESQSNLADYCEKMFEVQDKKLDKIDENINSIHMKLDKMTGYIDYLMKTTEAIKEETAVIAYRQKEHEDKIVELEKAG